MTELGPNRRRLVTAVVGVVVIGSLGACENSTSTANDRPGNMSDSHIGKGIEKVKERFEGSNSSETSEEPFESYVTTTTVLSSTHNSANGVAIGLYNAWTSGNKAEASNFATARAIEQLFTYTPASSRPAHANPNCLGGDDMVNCSFGTVEMYLPTPVRTGTWLVTYVEVPGLTPTPTTTTTTPISSAGALAAKALYDHWQAGDRAGAAAVATESVIEGLFKRDPMILPGLPECTIDFARPSSSVCSWDGGEGQKGLYLWVSAPEKGSGVWLVDKIGSFRRPSF